MPANTSWSPTELARLRRLLAAGWTDDDIATVLPRTAAAVGSMRRRLRGDAAVAYAPPAGAVHLPAGGPFYRHPGLNALCR